MARIEQSITVNVPLKTAYNQWTQFEDFPEFMDGIEHVEQLDDRRLRWTANIAGKEETWRHPGRGRSAGLRAPPRRGRPEALQGLHREPRA
jgi:hypothetical protein